MEIALPPRAGKVQQAIAALNTGGNTDYHMLADTRAAQAAAQENYTREYYRQIAAGKRHEDAVKEAEKVALTSTGVQVVVAGATSAAILAASAGCGPAAPLCAGVAFAAQAIGIDLSGIAKPIKKIGSAIAKPVRAVGRFLRKIF